MLDDYVQELTILNVFFVFLNRYGQLELVTPLDNGCILPGVIRKSILEMKDKIYEDTGMITVEKAISIHEIMSANEEGRLVEVIGCSTPSFI